MFNLSASTSRLIRKVIPSKILSNLVNLELIGRLTHQRQECNFHRTLNYPGIWIIYIRIKQEEPVQMPQIAQRYTQCTVLSKDSILSLVLQWSLACPTNSGSKRQFSALLPFSIFSIQARKTVVGKSRMNSFSENQRPVIDEYKQGFAAP